MLVVALLLLPAAPIDPNGVDVGISVGASASLPPCLFLDVGTFAQLRVSSVVVRADVSYGFFPLGDVQMGQASVVAGWVFALPLENMDVFIAGGPALGALRTSFDTIAVP